MFVALFLSLERFLTLANTSQMSRVYMLTESRISSHNRFCVRCSLSLSRALSYFGEYITDVTHVNAHKITHFLSQQVGFFLQSIHPWIEEFIAPAAGKHWTSEDAATHEALVAFAYLSGSTYVVLTFVLFCGSGGLQKSMMDDGPRSIELEHNNSSNNNNTNNA